MQSPHAISLSQVGQRSPLWISAENVLTKCWPSHLNQKRPQKGSKKKKMKWQRILAGDSPGDQFLIAHGFFLLFFFFSRRTSAVFCSCSWLIRVLAQFGGKRFCRLPTLSVSYRHDKFFTSRSDGEKRDVAFHRRRKIVPTHGTRPFACDVHNKK